MGFVSIGNNKDLICKNLYSLDLERVELRLIKYFTIPYIISPSYFLFYKNL